MGVSKNLLDAPFLHLVEEVVARLFEHLDYEVEALTTLVVWVWNMVVGTAKGRKVVAHTIDLVNSFSCRCKATDTLVVAVVHYDDAVEIVEIRYSKWA